MAYQFNKIRVLLVEDNPHMRKLLKALLEAVGVRDIVVAQDGGVAWMLMKKEPIDFALIDWEMYPVDGLELVRKIRTEPDSPNQFLPIIMVTAHTERARVMKARDLGVTEFLAKPVSAQTLSQRIEELIERPRPYIRTREFFGPCRRRSKKGGAYIGPERRTLVGA
jgi:two-component system, chemotaxis family, chemotaxis protein CheY